MPIFGPGKRDIQRRLEHRQQARPVADFIQHTRGRTLEALRFEAGPRTEQIGPSETQQGLGPDGFRYVYDPTEPPGARGPGDPGGSFQKVLTSVNSHD
jgi:hypothetical protein